ncbi:MAG: ATP-binding protein [Acidimicrobiales bacterium]
MDAARHFVGAAVGDWGIEAEDAVLVASELATNAVLHARSQFTVTLTCDDGELTVEVADHNPRLPVVVPAPSSALSGRGLHIVDAVSAAWGVHSRPDDGKTIWAKLR